MLCNLALQQPIYIYIYKYTCYATGVSHNMRGNDLLGGGPHSPSAFPANIETVCRNRHHKAVLTDEV